MERRELPIFEIEKEILEAFREGRRAVIRAPTGSGKSTQVPQMLLDGGILGEGQVVVLQPRRLPTRMLAARVAAERGVRLGEEVGYQIRLDHRAGPSTRIRFVTEGLLLRQMLNDPALKGVSAILFDEFHERHLEGDIALSRALDIQETLRPDLRLGVMSATLATEALAKHLAPCRVLHSEGRMFPVEIRHLDRAFDPERESVWDVATFEFEKLGSSCPEGDVLVFMPGVFEIQRTIGALRASSAARGFDILPLHGELPPAEQDAAVARSERRKIIVATNVAETSLTIEGVRVVMDSGLARIPRFDPHRGINTLLVEKISRASAEQRAGRAGRTAPGCCFRLWTAADHALRPAQELPEVKRLDLAEVVLMLKSSGVADLRAFRWLEAPDARALERAETLLCDLGALETDGGTITMMGRRMLSFPMHPRYARMLLEAGERRCVRAVALMAALTQGRSVWIRRAGKETSESREEKLGAEASSDFFMLARAWRLAERSGYRLEECRRAGIHAAAARQVAPIFQDFVRIAREEGLEVGEAPVDDEAVLRCVLAGFSDHLAVRLDSGTLRCAMVHRRTGTLDPESVVRNSPLLVAADVRELERCGGELQVVLSLASAVKEEWLREMFPADLTERREAIYDPALRRVLVERQRMFRDLMLERRRTDDATIEDAARILANEVMEGRLVLHGWDDAVEQWIHRVNRLREWLPEAGLPAIGPEERQRVIEQVCLGALGYKEIKERPVLPSARALLTPAQQALVEREAPERVALPGGRKAKVVYAASGGPVISALIQDLYGVRGSLRIARGRVLLVIQVLAPNRRPVQVTQDLGTFWIKDYPKVRKELQRKYPRHKWE